MKLELAVILVSLAFFGGSCGKKKEPGQQPAASQTPAATPPADAAPAASAARETSADPVPCPEDDAQAQQSLARAWQLGDDQHVKLIGCTPLRVARKPVWLIQAWLDTGEPEDPSDSELRRVVITPAFELVASAKPASVGNMERREGWSGTVELADLDGDGTDEIIESYDVSKGGETEEFAEISRVSDNQILTLQTFPIGYDNMGAAEDETDVSECSVKLEIAEPDALGARTIRFEPDNPDKIEQCLSAPVTYALQGGMLVEVK